MIRAWVIGSLLVFCGCQNEPRQAVMENPIVRHSVPQTNIPGDWPPRDGEIFPDIELVDAAGAIHRLNEFKGRPILVEFIGMTCLACQSWSGGQFEHPPAQGNGFSIEKDVAQYARNLNLSDKRVWFVQVLLYNMQMQTPTSEDVARWKKRYEINRGENYFVFAPKNDLRGRASFDLIPGFQLVDHKMTVLKDATGHSPKDNLYTDLLPLFATIAGIPNN
jgi:hypothetical protein